MVSLKRALVCRTRVKGQNNEKIMPKPGQKHPVKGCFGPMAIEYKSTKIENASAFDVSYIQADLNFLRLSNRPDPILLCVAYCPDQRIRDMNTVNILVASARSYWGQAGPGSPGSKVGRKTGLAVRASRVGQGIALSEI